MCMSIGDKLKRLRGSDSLEEVAKNLNLTKQAIFNYENNIRVPRDEIKVRIAEYYNVSVQELFFS